MKTIIKSFYACAFFALMISCNKEDSTANLTIKMTDQPGNYDTVSVEIIDVQIHFSNEDDDENGWVSLPTETGNYDLLLLQDSVTTILSEEAEIPTGKLQQMRLMLGTNNYIVIDEAVYPLELTSQDKTGLKMNLNTTVESGDEIEILFDFNAHESIIKTGSERYKLKPVVKVLEVEVS
ncbi:DUF4382 domain-containing protein [Crocinitomix algicola]|uniref:DUF4382 domain-containing protein n=1 Tax=Crocinitomix algicola TaxID=1740263 RepID=UPI00082F9DC7|nr:DUF4382 domain-containing protein [Crocinitomix algicola]